MRSTIKPPSERRWECLRRSAWSSTSPASRSAWDPLRGSSSLRCFRCKYADEVLLRRRSAPARQTFLSRLRSSLSSKRQETHSPFLSTASSVSSRFSLCASSFRRRRDVSLKASAPNPARSRDEKEPTSCLIIHARHLQPCKNNKQEALKPCSQIDQQPRTTVTSSAWISEEQICVWPSRIWRA